MLNWHGHVRLLGRRYIAALVVIVLLFGPYIANLFERNTRYLYRWRRLDAVLLIACMGLMACACVVARAWVKRLNRPTLIRLFDHVFVLALGAGLLTNIWFHSSRPQGYHWSQFGIEIQTAWWLLFAVVGYSLARPDSKLVLRCRQVCQCLLPVPLILAVQLLLLPTYPSVSDPLPTASTTPWVPTSESAQIPKPVYLLVFDEWSYQRTFDQGQVRPMLPNLAQLVKQSILFHDAHSGGDNTALSMPRLIFETDMEPTHHGGLVEFKRDGELVAPHDCKALFSAANDHHYRSFMIGLSLPYSLWLQDKVDVCRSYCWYPQGKNVMTSMTIHAFNAIQYWPDPWSHLFYVRWKYWLAEQHILHISRNIRRDALAVIREQGPNTFAMFHLLVPHHPYILDPDGRYRGPHIQAWEKSNTEGYHRNLMVMDHMIGEFIKAMKETGKYDDALIILTSDHSWRNDPNRKAGKSTCPLTHVPLIVKLPGQTCSLSIESHFEHLRLGQLIRLALQGQTNPTTLLRLAELDLLDTGVATLPDKLAQNKPPQ